MSVNSCLFITLSRRAYSSKTRIKTLNSVVADGVRCLVGEHIPVKQGLIHCCRRPFPLDPHGRRRAYSSKTRIKTQIVVTIVRLCRVGEHIPVKQGLRPLGANSSSETLYVGEHIPVKQGLRLQLIVLATKVFATVGEHIPVKQGLRQVNARLSPTAGQVGEHIPVKQGLRPFLFVISK